MTRPPASSERAAPPSFKDGLGTRVRVTDAGGDPVEQLQLVPDVAAQESAIRDRVGRLINFRHARYVRLRGVDRAKTGQRPLFIAYDALEGHRLSAVLESLSRIALTVEVDVALQIVRDLLPAIGILHDSRKVTHGAIAPERLVYTSQQRLMIVDHGLGAALMRMNLPRKKLWEQYRIASPAANRAVFDEKMDVVQIGLVALALLLGRPLTDEEYPAQVKRLIFSVKETSSKIGSRPIGPELRRWLERATGVDEAQTFATIKEAQDAFETVVAVDRYAPTAAAVKGFFIRYDELLAKLSPAVTEEAAPASGAAVDVDSALSAMQMQVTIAPRRRPVAEAPPVVAEAVEVKPTARGRARLEPKAEPAAQAEARPESKPDAVKLGRRKSDRLDALQALQEEMNAAAAGDVSTLEQTAGAVYDAATQAVARPDGSERLAREAAERGRQEAETREQAEREGRALAEQVARDAAEQVARESAERAVAERHARAASEREAVERGARQEAEQKAHEASLRATRETAEREVAQRAARDASARAESEREARQRLERESQAAAERRDREQAEREAAERAAQARREEEARERDARAAQDKHEAVAQVRQEFAAREAEAIEKARQEAAAREAEAVGRARQEAEAREAAERQAREQAEREARANAERAQKEAAERAAAEKAAREAAARAEKEAAVRAAAERAAQEAAERAERVEREAVERAERMEREALERAQRMEREAEERAARAEREASERAEREAAARAAAERQAQELAEREALAAERVRKEAAERAAAEAAAREAAQRAEREAAERKAAERVAREAAERAAREASERAAAEQAAREAAEREAAHKAARELAEQAVLEAAEREAAHRLALQAAEQAVREAAERAEVERAAREAAEQAAREASERALADLAAQHADAREGFEAAGRVAAERAAREHAEAAEQARLARAEAEREAREAGERAQREAAERAAAERAAREHAARAEAEREARAAAEREARAAADRAERHAAERHAAERAAREAAALMEAERQARAAAEQAAREAADRAAREAASREAAERAARQAAELAAETEPRRRRRKKRPAGRTPEEASAVQPLPSATENPAAPAPSSVSADPSAAPLVQWQAGESVDVLPAWARGASTETPATPASEPETAGYTPSPSAPATAIEAHTAPAPSATVLSFKPQAPDTWMQRAPQAAEDDPLAESRAVAPGPTTAPRRSFAVNWARTLAATLLVALLEGVAFATAWWYVTPEEQGWLVIHTKPAGIQVSVDGTVLGKTPLARALAPGRHTIELRYGTGTRVVPVEISAGVQTEQRVSWGNGFTTGQAAISSTNAGARVLIDGRVMGKTPLTVSDLLPGKHEVTVEEEKGSVSTMLMITAGQTTELDVPVYAGWASVLSPVQLDILLGGKLIGSTEIEKLMLRPGRHTLELVNESLGYRGSVDVRVRPGATTSVSVVPKTPVTIEAPEGTELSINGENMGTLPNPGLQVPLGTAEFVMRYKDEERRLVLPVTMSAPVTVKYELATVAEREPTR